MGIKGLTKLLAEHAPNAMKEQKFESYFGRKIAIDASMSIYQFLIVVGRNGTQILTNEAGEVTSHLQGMLTRTIRLLEAGLKPVKIHFLFRCKTGFGDPQFSLFLVEISVENCRAKFVFDGQPPDLKKHELAKRLSKREEATKYLNTAIEVGNKEEIEKFSKRTVKISKQHNDGCKRLLRLMGVPVIEAPSEAEAECVSLCKAGKVYAMSSEDMDSLTFGAPRFLRHLMDPISKKIPVKEFEISKVLEELELSMDQFIDLCILCGCDYCDSIKGIGRQTALKLITQHGTIETVLEKINRERYIVPEDWPYENVRHWFKSPIVSNDIEELKWTSPDEEGLMKFLVDENGFNSDRIIKSIEKIEAAKNKTSQGRLQSSFRPMENKCLPLKTKNSRCELIAAKPALKPKILTLHANMLLSLETGSLKAPLKTNGFICHNKSSLGVCLGL